MQPKIKYIKSCQYQNETRTLKINKTFCLKIIEHMMRYPRDFDSSCTSFNPPDPPHTFPLELGFPGVDPVPGPAAGPLVEPRVHVGVGARLPPGRGVQS